MINMTNMLPMLECAADSRCCAPAEPPPEFPRLTASSLSAYEPTLPLHRRGDARNERARAVERTPATAAPEAKARPDHRAPPPPRHHRRREPRPAAHHARRPP